MRNKTRQKEIFDEVYKKEERDYWSEVRYGLFKNGLFGKLLDVGCGNGYANNILTSVYHGLDISENAGHFADEFHKGGMERLPFEEDHFDDVLMFEVIEHSKNPEKAIVEAKRVLREGGKIIITTPNKNNLFVGFYERIKRLRFVRRMFGREEIEAEQHEKEFDCDEMEELLRTAGFRDIKVKAIGLGAAFLFSFLVYGRFKTILSKIIIWLDYRLPAVQGHNIIAEAMK